MDYDLKLLRGVSIYKGLRHSWGLPVRGQRIKSGYTHAPGRKKRRGGPVAKGKKKTVRK